MRMFAGPNGSGKSALKAVLPAELLGVYLNPDEIEAQIRRDGWLTVTDFGVTATADEILGFLANAPLLLNAGYADQVRRLEFIEGRLGFNSVPVDAYYASAIVEFLREKLLVEQASFTVETVMSHPGKVALLEKAQRAGYRTYLYYIATDDPAINVSRVANRVKLGGHPVPSDRIEQRYHRSLALLRDAIRHTNRAYVFDNSGDNADHRHTWLAEITDGRELELQTDLIPAWFRRAVLDKITHGS
jgi:predicted ABC-type ATPase